MEAPNSATFKPISATGDPYLHRHCTTNIPLRTITQTSPSSSAISNANNTQTDGTASLAGKSSTNSEHAE